jgi:predicted XRE-type DNA-binding protein
VQGKAKERLRKRFGAFPIYREAEAVFKRRQHLRAVYTVRLKGVVYALHAGLIKSKGLTQAKAAALLGLAQPDVSKLLRGHFGGYSYERLFGFLNALGEKVRIEVSGAKTRKEARLELEMFE